MTTIACDGITIAADGLRCAGSEIVSRSERKIRIYKGRLYAISGVSMMFERAMAWHAEGAVPEKMPTFGDGKGDDSYSLYVVQDHGLERFHSASHGYSEVYPYPCAFGSGGDYAQGVLAAGGTARKAIEAASTLDVYTGGEITEFAIASFVAAVPNTAIRAVAS